MPQPVDDIATVLSALDKTRTAREELYQHLHRNPELSHQEFATADKIADVLTGYGINVARVGDTGLVATLTNGEGPTVAMRADIDALPVKETSGKDYASTATAVDPTSDQEVAVSHACGHDVHIVALVGALQALHDHLELWSGTFIGIFQPAEETASGAQSMVTSGLNRAMPTPDVFFAQHVLSSLPGGQVGTKVGPVLSEAASIKVTVHGRGSHGSMPELAVDPVVLAASIVTRLQSVVSREVAAGDTAVLTVGAMHAGTKSNIIPESAELLINTRAYDSDVANHMHEAIERIVRAECEAARSPQEPEFVYYDQYPLTSNDEETTRKVRSAFDKYFGTESTGLEPVPASEDFSVLPNHFGTPYVYWGLGGFADQENAPGNHNPSFAPDLQPTLDRGAEAIIVAASPWLLSDT